jgi:hypothetical protein
MDEFVPFLHQCTIRLGEVCDATVTALSVSANGVPRECTGDALESVGMLLFSRYYSSQSQVSIQSALA